MDRFAEVRRLENLAVSKMVTADRQPWRLLRNFRLRREAREILAEANTELERVRRTPR